MKNMIEIASTSTFDVHLIYSNPSELSINSVAKSHTNTNILIRLTL